jgi:hypothetical protein
MEDIPDNLLEMQADATPCRFSVGVVSSAIYKAKAGTAPGPDGWRFEHYKALIGGDGTLSTAEYLNTLCSYLNAIAADEAPREVYSLLGQGKLIALTKPSKPGDVRPIAMGSVDRRMVAKCLATHLRGELDAFFMPLQHGVGNPGGIETIRHYIASLKVLHPNWVFLQIDFANAFNSISRSHCLKEVSTHFEHLLPFLRSIYAPTSKLWVNLESGKSHLESAEGAQQGDPLGPFLFSVGLQPILDAVNTNLCENGSIGCVLAYLDDVVIAGSCSSQT